MSTGALSKSDLPGCYIDDQEGFWIVREEVRNSVLRTVNHPEPDKLTEALIKQFAESRLASHPGKPVRVTEKFEIYEETECSPPALLAGVGDERQIARLNAVETAEELEAARFTDMAPNVHIIIGSGGRCMCGIYSGKAFSCSEILSQRSQDFQSAIIAAQMIAENGGEPV